MFFLAWNMEMGKGLRMLRRMGRSLVDLCDLIYCSVILRLLGMYLRLMTRGVMKLCLECVQSPRVLEHILQATSRRRLWIRDLQVLIAKRRRKPREEVLG